MSRPFPDDLFEREKSHIINPHDRLCPPAIPASSLRLGHHFVPEVLSSALFDEIKEKFQTYYDQVLKSPDYGYNAPLKIREAMFDILNKVRVTEYYTIPYSEYHTISSFIRPFCLFGFFKGEILKGVIHTEQELRYCVCDPLVEMICKMWNLKVCVEFGCDVYTILGTLM